MYSFFLGQTPQKSLTSSLFLRVMRGLDVSLSSCFKTTAGPERNYGQKKGWNSEKVAPKNISRNKNYFQNNIYLFQNKKQV